MSEALDAPTGGGEVAPEPAVTIREPVQSWQQQYLSDVPDLASNPSVSQVPDVKTLAKNYINAEKMVGADKVALLNENSTDEERNAHYLKLGRPAKAEDYDLTDLKIPEGLPMVDGFQEEIVSRMHGHGLSQTQLMGVLKDYYELVGGQHTDSQQNVQQAQETALKDLKTEWGASYDAQVAIARSALVAGAGDESILDLAMADGTTFGNNPAVIKLLASLGGRMSEHGLVGDSAPRTTMSRQEARQTRQELMADSDFIAQYTDKDNPRHEWANKRLHDLYAMEFANEE